MREIKFRAWIKKENKISRVFQLFIADKGIIVFCIDDKTNTINIGQDFKLLQYTGFRDRKNNEIYEGDLVKTYFSRDYYEVNFVGNGWVIWNDGRERTLEIRDRNTGALEQDDEVDCDRLVVVGNIFQGIKQ